MKIKKWLIPAVLASFILTLFGGVSIIPANAQSKIRIGTYDSRYVALAFYRADNMKQINDFMVNLKEELNKARESGDKNKIKELEARGPAFQNLTHQQVFGNLSIPNVMATIKDQLPAIAQKAGVTMIVSKWEIQYSEPWIEQVDLTMQILDLFHIDDVMRKMIEESIRTNLQPVPVEQLLNPYD
jgi:cysteinyl-tRNA synthetase